MNPLDNKNLQTSYNSLKIALNEFSDKYSIEYPDNDIRDLLHTLDCFIEQVLVFDKQESPPNCIMKRD